MAEKEKRKNIIIRGLEIKSGEKEGVEEVLNKIEMKTQIKRIKRIGVGREESKGVVAVKVGGDEEKKKITRKKRNLKGRNEKIIED